MPRHHGAGRGVAKHAAEFAEEQREDGDESGHLQGVEIHVILFVLLALELH